MGSHSRTFFRARGFTGQAVANIRKQSEVVAAAQGTLTENSNKLVKAEKKIADYKFKIKTTK